MCCGNVYLRNPPPLFPVFLANSFICRPPCLQDDVDNPAEGRMKAVMQTTPWFLWLESVDEEEDEED